MNNVFFITNGLTLFSFIFVLLIFILFLLKGKATKIRSKLFVALVICSIVACIFYIGWGSLVSNNHIVLGDYFSRICSFIFVIWDFLLVFYLIAAISDESDFINKFKNNKISYLSLCLFLIIINLLLCIFLPVKNYRISDGLPYLMSGPLVMYYNILGFVLLFASIIIFIFNLKKFDKITKLLSIPTGIIILLSIVLSTFEIFVVNDVCFRFVALIIFLYFSIESFDANILNDFNKSVNLAKESDRLKSEFFMSMSHQLRTPLNSILGFSDLIIDNNSSDKNIYLDDINNIKVSSVKLLNLINSILDISKLESGKDIVNDKNYNLDNIIFDISSNINSKLKSNLVFTINVDEICPNELIGDEVKLSKILNLILMNAINCTEYGEVSLNVSCIQIDSSNYEFTFLIKNSGHVASFDDFNKSFEDLIALSSNGHEIKPEILKLIIAKTLINMIGADIEFVNETGKGTQYIIKLKQKLYGQNRIGNIRDKIQTKQSLIYNFNMSGKKILIIDDD